MPASNQRVGVDERTLAEMPDGTVPAPGHILK
jgi:hypothetical protein